MLKTIVLTWIDRRIDAPRWSANQVMVALWCAEGDDQHLNGALAHAARENRKNPASDYRVHTFAPDETQWRGKAALAHR